MRAIQRRTRRLSESVLRHLKFPRRRTIPRLRLIPHNDLLVRIIQMHNELARKDRFRGRCDAAVCAERICGQRRLRPFWDEEDFTVDYLRDVGVAERDCVAVLGGGRRWVWVAEVVGWSGFIAVVAKIDGPGMFILAMFEVKCCARLLAGGVSWAHERRDTYWGGSRRAYCARA